MGGNVVAGVGSKERGCGRTGEDKPSPLRDSVGIWAGEDKPRPYGILRKDVDLIKRGARRVKI